MNFLKTPLTRKDYLWISLFGLFILAMTILSVSNGGDFDIFLFAARNLGDHLNIYTILYNNNDELHYYYSVFFAMVLEPFSNHVFITELIWSFLSLFFLYRSFKIIESHFEFSDNHFYKKWLWLTIVCSLQFILYNISMIQLTFFLMWAILESIHLANKGKGMLGGSLLGLAINIKIMPLLILPYLFYRGYFKVIIACIITFIALLYLPGLFIGHDYNTFLLSEWWKVINPANKEHLFETGVGTHSIVSLIPAYLTETTGQMEYKRNIVHLSHGAVELIILLTRLGLLGLSLYFLRSLPFRKENDQLKSIWELNYFMLLIPLLLPHQQKYAFILAIPMVTYLIYFFISTFSFARTIGYKMIIALFLLSMVIYSPLYGMDVIGKFLYALTQHYKFITIATILLIPVSLYCSPQRFYELRGSITG